MYLRAICVATVCLVISLVIQTHAQEPKPDAVQSAPDRSQRLQVADPPFSEGPRMPFLRNLFDRTMSVNVPVFYDMVRNGSSLGINVLSGLVKVERGEMAERSGLQPSGGRRPLSVRIFGVPVYERGIRVSNPDVPPQKSNDDEELPLDP